MIDRLASTPLTERRLDAVKRQYLGQLLVASCSGEALALSAAKQMLYSGTVLSHRQTTDSILAVTPADIVQVAQLITPDRWSTLSFL